MSAYPPFTPLPIFNNSGSSSSSGGDFTQVNIGSVSENNSTTTQLAGGATFTGPYEDVSGMSSISIVGNSDQEATLYALFSNDGVSISRNVQLSSGGSGNMGIHNLIPVAKYFAMRVINGATPSTTLDVQTIYNKNPRVALPTSRINQAIDNFADCINTRAVLQGRNENGETFSQVEVTAKNNLKVSIKEPLSAFNEVMVSNLTPRIQIDAIYGVVTTDVVTTVSGTGGVTASNSNFYVSTGLTANSTASLQSRRHMSYKPGEGSRFRFTAAFTTGVADSFQFAGASNINNAVGFCYKDDTFGILLRKPGAPYITRLTISAGSNGTEQITVTLNSVVLYQAVPPALSTSALAEYLVENATWSDWTSSLSPRSNGSTIIFVQGVPAVAGGTYSYATNGGGGGTSAGSFTTIQVGVANDDTTFFYPQEEWNLDVCDGSNSASNPSGILLDQTKLNVYQVVYPYLGAGTLLFYIMDEEGHFEYVHQIEYPNSYILPSCQNPTFTLGYIAQSNGSTTNLTVSGSSLAGFVEGLTLYRRPPFSWSKSNFSAGTTEYCIFALRTRSEFNSVVNYRELYPVNLSCGTETSNRVITCKIYLNATLSGTVNWQYVDQSLSSIEYAEPTTITPSGGSIIAQAIFASGSPLILDLEKIGIRITENESIVISLVTASGTAVTSCSLNWVEE